MTIPAAPTRVSVTPGKTLPEQDASQLMYYTAFGSDPQEAINTIQSAGDTCYIAVFIEIMRANQIGLLSG